ncbi:MULTISPECIES: ExbD/TolR family protein [Vibrio]|jgi:biopolymer transport protein ExbD|uniref:Biopolymer transporter ExbD n=10 Tax=Vibrio TaxID=662 RepID=A0A120DHK3_9VIBR|nr:MULTISPECIES: biopolymer transporter ExbD [Vibrio]ANP78175.1 biopolymer transporter ExbD [Vibrio crassostreae 9CS106]EDK28668.1 TolR protein [Vibrionales bacterium SWAT-3]KNH12148.1 biopolymer transporter ExbD [Vibrio lentus]MBY7663015.1 biopolymer transporter ExbD [Vibrio atlanticus]EGU43370.1 putative TonB system transport protein [Vibrio splendidus ATCC 33789]|tara:strand:+ start:809 stop:1213 length:405 start_codon:yes stop_codon:yes gene_type:complete
MRLGRRHSKNEEAQIDLTSMLDIVFIMLIFFIVTSSFVRESGVEVNRPQASNVVSQKDAGIFVAITSANDIFIDKRVVDVERVQATLEHLLLEQPDASLVIQADEHAYNGTVVKVMDAAKGAGVKNIALAADKR